MALGIVLTPYGQIPGAPPWEIGYSYGGDGTYLCPYDPQFNTRGEPGFYHDTRLGGPRPAVKSLYGGLSKMAQRRVAKALRGLGRAIPSDYELEDLYGYVPMMDGGVAAKEGFQPGGWIPPNGWDPAGQFGPPFVPRAGVSGFGDAAPVIPTPITTAPQPSVLDLIAQMQERNNKLFILSIISTAAITLSAIITTIRNAKLIKQEQRLIAEEEALLSAQG